MSASTAASSAFSPAPASQRPARAGPRGRRPEDLHVGVGADHGSDVAAVEHAPAAGGEIALERQERLAHRAVRDPRGGSPTRWLFSTDRRTRRVELGGEGGGARLVARSAPASSMARATAR